MTPAAVMGPLIASTYRRFFMTRYTMPSQWRHLRRRVREFWGSMSPDEVALLDGTFDNLTTKVQEKYGVSRQQAERQVNEFLARCEAQRRPPLGTIDDIELQH